MLSFHQNSDFGNRPLCLEQQQPSPSAINRSHITVEYEINRGKNLRAEKPVHRGKPECDVVNIKMKKSYCDDLYRNRRINSLVKYKKINPCFLGYEPSPLSFSNLQASKSIGLNRPPKVKLRRKCPMRIAELAVPTKRKCIDTWRNKSYLLPALMVDRLKQNVMDQRPIVQIQDALYCFQRRKSPSRRKSSKKKPCKCKTIQRPLCAMEAQTLCAIFGHKIAEVMINRLNLSLGSDFKDLYEFVAKDIFHIMYGQNNATKANLINTTIHKEMSSKVTIWILDVLEDASYKLLEDELRDLEEEEGPVLDFIDDLIDNAVTACEPVILKYDTSESSTTTSTSTSSDSSSCDDCYLSTERRETVETKDYHAILEEDDNELTDEEYFKKYIIVIITNLDIISEDEQDDRNIDEITENLPDYKVDVNINSEDHNNISIAGNEQELLPSNELTSDLDDIHPNEINTAKEIVDHSEISDSALEDIDQNEINMAQEIKDQSVISNTSLEEINHNEINMAQENENHKTNITTWENIDQNEISIIKENVDHSEISEAVLENIDQNEINVAQENVNQSEISNDITENIDQNEINITKENVDHGEISEAVLENIDHNEINVAQENVNESEISNSITENIDQNEVNIVHENEDENENNNAVLEDIDQNKINIAQENVDGNEINDSNVSRVFELFSEELLLHDDKNKKAKVSFINMVNQGPKLLPEASHMLADQSEENLKQEQIWSKHFSDPKLNIIYAEPNENLLSDVDELWPSDLTIPTLKASKSVIQSIKSLGNITEYDEKNITPLENENIGATVKISATTNEKNDSYTEDLVSVYTNLENTEHNLECTSDKSIGSSITKKAIKEEVPILIDMQVYDEFKYKTVPIQDTCYKENENDDLQATFRKKEGSKFENIVPDVSPVSATTKHDQEKIAKGLETTEHDGWNSAMITLSHGEIRKWAKDLENSYVNLELWINWMEKSCRNIINIRNGKELNCGKCLCLKRKLSPNWETLVNNIYKNVALWRNVYQSNQEKNKIFRRLYCNNKIKVASIACCPCQCACKNWT